MFSPWNHSVVDAEVATNTTDFFFHMKRQWFALSEKLKNEIYIQIPKECQTHPDLFCVLKYIYIYTHIYLKDYIIHHYIIYYIIIYTWYPLTLIHRIVFPNKLFNYACSVCKCSWKGFHSSAEKNSLMLQPLPYFHPLFAAIAVVSFLWVKWCMHYLEIMPDKFIL